MIPPFAGDSLLFSSRPVVDDVASWPVGQTPSPDYVFGAGSQLVQAADTISEPAAAGIAYSAALLACLAGWILIVYVYRDYILAAMGIVRGGVFAEKLLDKHNKLFSACLNWSVILGGVVAGLACSQDIAVTGICTGAIAAVWGFQWVVLAAAGGLTLYTEFTARMFYLRKIMAAAASMVLVPLFLLYALSGDHILGWCLAVSTSVAVIFIFVRTFMLFVRHRFSILLWILYLCAVEILPVATIVIVAGKLRLI